MESKGQQELRARALEALAAAWPAARSSRLALASDVLLLLEPFFKSPSMEERLAATSVASSFCARMSADLLGEGEAEGSMEEVLADVRKEWEVVAKTLFHGLYLGMNDLGPTRRAVRKAALTACEDWFALAAKLELAVGAEVGPGLCAQIAAVLRELIADQTDVKMRETAQGLLKKLELDSSGMAS